MSFQSKSFNIAFALLLASCPSSSRPAGQPGTLDKYLTSLENIPSPNFGVTNCIVRDVRGFLWFGTSNGLARFDGYEVRVFPIGSPTTTVRAGGEQVITAMIQMDDESLLLATHKGLWAFDLKSARSARFLAGAPFSESVINAIAKDSNGTLWIGTSSLGLFGYERSSESFRRYTTTTGLTDNTITSLLVDQTGNIWIGTYAGGLNALYPGESTFISYRASESDDKTLWCDRIAALCESADHELWIGTTKGLNVLDAARHGMRRVQLPSPTPHTIYSIAQDPAGRMWFTGTELALLIYDHGSCTQFASPPAGSVKSVMARDLNDSRVLYFDPVASANGRILLWVGTRVSVVKVLMSTNPFASHFRDQDSLKLDRGALLTMCQDREGILWVGLWGGGLEALRQVDGMYKRVSHFSARDALAENVPANIAPLPDGVVQAIVEDRTGNLWVGTSAGLAMLDPHRKHLVVDRHVSGDSTSMAVTDVYGIYEDHTGSMWICGRGGLSKLIRGNPNRFRNYLDDPAYAHPGEGNVVSCVLEDSRSNLWAVTFGHGLQRLEADGRFSRFTQSSDSSGSSENFIFTFTEDDHGLFWLSTAVGLVSFNPRSGEFRRFPIDELHAAHIHGIAAGRTGELWLSTQAGLARFNPVTRTFTRFDEKDGLPFKEFFSGFYRGSDGRLFVGGIDGFTEFFPQGDSKTSRPPEIVLTTVSVFDKEISAGVFSSNKIDFPYNQNFFSFSFAALDYANPLRNRFAYRMLGVDREWVEAGTRNYARYPNLDPGSYVFQVKGCNSDDVWNESGTSLAIVISPPYWQTWWFRLLFAGFIASAAYAAYRYRVRRVLEVERLRLRIADDLHDDVGSNLSTIAMVSRVIQRAPELTVATKSKLAEIYDTAISTSEGMKDIVWFIKPDHDTLDDLLLRMKDTGSSLLGDVQHEFEAAPVDMSLEISVDFKRNYFLAYKEILTNIVKHASATNVSIRVRHRDGLLETIIRDNGCGFDEQTVRVGNGLGSLRSRSQAIDGVCEISSRPGKGTTIRFAGRP